MNNYKLIACDLDGTLMGSDLKLSMQNRQAIKELADLGVLVVPATGRTICEMEDVFNLPGVHYVIYSNGAAIYDKITGENILFGLDSDASCFIFNTLNKYDTFSIIHKDGKTYADREKAQRLSYYNVNLNVKSLVKNNCILEDDYEKRFHDGSIECVVVFFADKTEAADCRRILSSNPYLYMAESSDCNLEIFYRDAGKGNALIFLAKKLNIEMKDVITIGDSDNDRQMTLLPALGLVTQNGTQSLKDIADKVICSNDEHVLKYVKEHYFI